MSPRLGKGVFGGTGGRDAAASARRQAARTEADAQYDPATSTSERPVCRTKGRALLIRGIGVSLPFALAVALSPFLVIGIVLILGGRDGRRRGSLFAAGWVAGLALVAVLVVVVFGGADDPDSTSSVVSDWLRVIAGIGFIAVGVRKWWARPGADDVEAVPGWMASLDDVTAARALLLGILLAVANPKNVVLTASAATAMVDVGAHGADLAGAVVVFVVLGSCTALGAVVLDVIGGRRAASVLDGVRGFIVANSTAIMVLVLLILGANVLGDGLAGLGQ